MVPRGGMVAIRTAALAVLLGLQLLTCGAEDDSRKVLFSVDIEIQSTGQTQNFQLRDGDNIAGAVSGFALSAGLSAEQERALLQKVNERAIALKLVPLKTLTVSLPGGKEAKLSVYEGDNIRGKVLEMVAAEGIDSSLEEEVLSAVINVLKKDRVVPVLSLDVEVPSGDKATLQMFRGDAEEDTVAAFASAHGLNSGQAENLAGQVHERTLFHRLKPLAELSVDGQAEPFQLFHGDVLNEAVGAYAKRLSMGAEEEATMLNAAGRKLVTSGLLPYATVTVAIPPRNGKEEHTEVITVRVTEDAKDVVDAFIALHGLTAEEGLSVLASVVKQGTEARVLPALEFPVYMEPQEPGAPQKQVMFRLYQGDEAATVVANFSRKYGVAEDRQAALLEHTLSTARSARLMPKVVLSVNMTSPEKEGKVSETIPIQVPIYEGDSVGERAEAVAREAGLPEDAVTGLRESAVAEGKRARLEPIFIFNVSIGQDKHTIEAFVGDNVTALGMKFAEDYRMSNVDTDMMLGQITLVAMQNRLIPMISVPVSITLEDVGNTTKYALDIYHGDNIEGSVDGFLSEIDLLPEEKAKARETLLQKATEQAYEQGILPIIDVPVTFHGEESLIKVFKGDSPDEAVQRFLSRQQKPEGWSDENRLQLVDKVAAKAKDARLLPLMQLDLRAGDRTVPLYLFKGDNITSLMKNLAAELKLQPEEASELEAQVISRAQAKRLMPSLTIPVRLDGGQTDELVLFVGDSIKEAVAKFGEFHSIPGDHLGVLEEAATARATQARILPAIKLDVRVGGVPQELLLYTGDNITEAVQAFVERHHLGDIDSKTVGDAVNQQAIDRRMVPEHIIPVDVEGENGERTKSLQLVLFKGDKLEEKAAAFVKENELALDLDKFVESVRKFMQHQATAAAGKQQTAKKDEL